MPLAAIAEIEARFELPLPISLVAHFAFGVTGALAALRRGYDVIGVLMLSLVTAVGGGMLRDGLLISQGPASFATDRSLFFVVFGSGVATLLFHRFLELLERPIAVIDAIGLGAFAVYGVERSLQAGLTIPGAILGGTITAIGGGLLRDVLVRDEPLLFKPGQFYGLVAIGGCVLFVAILRFELMAPAAGALVTTVLVFVVRMLAIRFNWRTRAVRRPPAP